MRALGRVSIAGVLLCLAFAGPAVADGPGVGTPTVVTLGDSAISGEAGRWAGNTNMSAWRVDALGSSAYWDTANGEAIKGCHRSKAAQAHIGNGVASLNLACSGARTSTGGTGSGEDFKPGIDFYSGPKGVGQALALQEYAKTHNVKTVVVMIGANNYGFAAIVERCVTNWVTSPSWWKNYCSDDSDIRRGSRRRGRRRRRRTSARRSSASPRPWGTRATPRASTRSSPRPTGRRSRAGRRSATPRAAGRASRSAAAALEPRPQLGQRHRRRRDEQDAKNAAARPGLPNVKVLDLQNALDGRRLSRTRSGSSRRSASARGRSRARSTARSGWRQIRTVTTLIRPTSSRRPARQLLGPEGDAQLPAAGLHGGTVRGGTLRAVSRTGSTPTASPTWRS